MVYVPVYAPATWLAPTFSVAPTINVKSPDESVTMDAPVGDVVKSERFIVFEPSVTEPAPNDTVSTVSGDPLIANSPAVVDPARPSVPDVAVPAGLNTTVSADAVGVTSPKFIGVVCDAASVAVMLTDASPVTVIAFATLTDIAKIHAKVKSFFIGFSFFSPISL